jgi:hypothetical protein
MAMALLHLGSTHNFINSEMAWRTGVKI